MIVLLSLWHFIDLNRIWKDNLQLFDYIDNFYNSGGRGVSNFFIKKLWQSEKNFQKGEGV